MRSGVRGARTGGARLLRPLLALSLLGLFACAERNPGGPACTADGCLDGLVVILEGDLPAQFTLEVRDLERDLAVSRDCDAASCLQVFLDGFTAEEVEVAILSAEGTNRASFRPHYERSVSGCGTVCHFGQIHMTLEE